MLANHLSTFHHPGSSDVTVRGSTNMGLRLPGPRAPPKKLETRSLEVAPTTFWLVLLIYSFQFRSVFLVAGTDFLNFTHTLSQNETFFVCDLELWHMTLTYGLNLDRVKLNQPAKYLDRRLFCSTVIVQTHKHTHTHAADQLLHMATKWSVKIDQLNKANWTKSTLTACIAVTSYSQDSDCWNFYPWLRTLLPNPGLSTDRYVTVWISTSGVARICRCEEGNKTTRNFLSHIKQREIKHWTRFT